MLEGDLERRILERIRKIPAYDKFGLEMLNFSQGLCELKCPHDREFDGIFESFHGGLLMAVADMAACFAIMTHTGPDERMATTDMSIRFLAPCLTDVRAVAKVIKLGRSLCPVQVDLYDMNGKQVAVAQVCYMRVS